MGVWEIVTYAYTKGVGEVLGSIDVIFTLYVAGQESWEK